MAAIGFALLWVGYSIGLYGWILVKGYDINSKDLFSRTQWPPAGPAQ